MGKPRVIFVNRVYWPSLAATAQLLTDLAEGLAVRGWTVEVIAAGDESGAHRGVTIHRTGAGEKHAGMISRARNYWRFICRVRSELAIRARPGDVVVLMTDPPLLGAAVTQVALNRGARVVHWIQDIYPEIVTEHVGALLAWPLFPLRMKRDASWRLATSCVVLGDTMARTVADHGISQGSIATIPNWAPRELNNLADATHIAAQRQTWELSDKFIVAYSGNLGRVHEFSAILIAAEILQSHPEIVFLFIGAGARLAEVQSAANAKGLHNIRILPPVPRENLAASLSAADVHLVTLKPEFTPLVYPSKLAGALAAGRPVIFIGQPEGEIAQLLTREACGEVVSPAEGTRLAEILIAWRNDPAKCAKRGERARATGEKIFTFDAALAQWEKILKLSGDASVGDNEK